MYDSLRGFCVCAHITYAITLGMIRVWVIHTNTYTSLHQATIDLACITYHSPHVHQRVLPGAQTTRNNDKRHSQKQRSVFIKENTFILSFFVKYLHDHQLIIYRTFKLNFGLKITLIYMLIYLKFIRCVDYQASIIQLIVNF